MSDEFSPLPAFRMAIGATAAIVGASSFAVIETTSMGLPWIGRLIAALCVGASGAALGTVSARPWRHELHVLRQQLHDEQTSSDERRHRSELLARCDQALSVAENEGEVLSAVARTFDELLDGRTNSLLLCSTANGEIAWTVGISPDGVDVPVTFAGDGRCVAIATGRAAASMSSTDLDACPHSDPTLLTSAVCIPIAITGQPFAVLHSAGPLGELPSADELEIADRIALRARDRLAGFAPDLTDDPPEIIDPLTGLANHHTARRTIRDLIGGLIPFSIAVCDVDALERYNEHAGYGDGDRALRQLGLDLRTAVRPGDVVVRWGDDEFLAVFPRCSSLNALSAMERVRETLVLTLSESGLAPLTCSVGVSDSNQGSSIEELLETADLALSVAKHEGGNRVRLAVFEADGCAELPSHDGLPVSPPPPNGS